MMLVALSSQYFAPLLASTTFTASRIYFKWQDRTSNLDQRVQDGLICGLLLCAWVIFEHNKMKRQMARHG
jgi:hypothetical protein